VFNGISPFTSLFFSYPLPEYRQSLPSLFSPSCIPSAQNLGCRFSTAAVPVLDRPAPCRLSLCKALEGCLIAYDSLFPPVVDVSRFFFIVRSLWVDKCARVARLLFSRALAPCSKWRVPLRNLEIRIRRVSSWVELKLGGVRLYPLILRHLPLSFCLSKSSS